MLITSTNYRRLRRSWPSDTPCSANSQLQQMIGKQLEQNPNPKTRARALDVVYNLNAQESDPDQIGLP